jgi:hypothetical protein
MIIQRNLKKYGKNNFDAEDSIPYLMYYNTRIAEHTHQSYMQASGFDIEKFFTATPRLSVLARNKSEPSVYSKEVTGFYRVAVCCKTLVGQVLLTGQNEMGSLAREWDSRESGTLGSVGL